jgi:hypothetical protein
LVIEDHLNLQSSIFTLHYSIERRLMEGRKSGKPAEGRLEALRNLPKDVMSTLTKEEIDAFLHEDEWPDSLREKLKAYIVE